MEHLSPSQGQAVLLLIWLPVAVPGRTADDGSNTWAPAQHVGGLDAVPGSWLPSDTALAVAGIWGMNQ